MANLERIATLEKASRSEVLRRALGIYDWLLDEIAGARVETFAATRGGSEYRVDKFIASGRNAYANRSLSGDGICFRQVAKDSRSAGSGINRVTA